MSDGDAKRSHVRIAAAILAAILVGRRRVHLPGLHRRVHVDTDTVTVTSPRAGLVMDRTPRSSTAASRSARSKSIEYAGDQAKLTLVDRQQRDALHPVERGGAHRGHNGFRCQVGRVRAAGAAHRAPLRPGAKVQAEDVQLEVNTLFQTLTDVLHKIDPVNLNATLTALAEGLRGNGDDLGATAVRAELLSAAAESEAADACRRTFRRPRWWPTSTATPAPIWPGSSTTHPRSATPSSTSRTT